MTEQEALALRPGDRVEARYLPDEWALVRVVAVEVVTVEWLALHQRFLDRVRIGDLRYVVVRRDSLMRTAKGRPLQYPMVNRAPRNLRPCPDPVAANVYSDWLWENGHYEAAAALRKRFPLATGEPDTGGAT